MKKLLKNQNGAVILVIIVVLVIATVSGGATFLGVRMLVSGDGNFLQPFEDLGWIDSKDEEDNEDTDKNDNSSKTKKESGNSSKYLIDEAKLSSQSKKSGIKHYYGKINMSEEADMDDDFSEYADLMKAGINIYAKDGKAVEIAFGFDISEFCEKMYKEYKEELSKQGITSSKDLKDMMMKMIESMFDEMMSEEYSEYIKIYSDSKKGTFQMYITEEGFESLYEIYDIDEDEEDVDVFIESLEDAFSTEINLVED